MKRHEAMAAIVDFLREGLVISTNGGATTDWEGVVPEELVQYQLQMKTLGLCSSVALGLALALPHRPVAALDGDGSILMNAGSLASIGRHRPPNLFHVVFDNGSYESSGEQLTHTGAAAAAGRPLDLAGMARCAGVPATFTARTPEDLAAAARDWQERRQCTFVHAIVESGRLRRSNALDEVENKYRFVRAVERSEGIDILGLPLSGSMVTNSGTLV